jgi:hypothetical protein
MKMQIITAVSQLKVDLTLDGSMHSYLDLYISERERERERERDCRR